MKLLIKENVITDLKQKNIINLKDAKETLLSWAFKVNLEDCTIVQFRPRSYMAAKNNENIIIGIKSNTSYHSGWRSPERIGNVVMGIYGNSNFISVYGPDSIRANFAECDTFYEVIPVSDDSYTKRSDKTKALGRTGEYRYYTLDDSGDLNDARYDYDSKGKKRLLSLDDVKMYDPNINKRRYINILSKNHLNKYVNNYEDLCRKFNIVRQSISNIDSNVIINNRYDYSRTIKCLDSYLDSLSDLNRYIKDVDKQSVDDTGWFTYTEKDLERAFVKCEDKYDDLLTCIEKLEGLR